MKIAYCIVCHKYTPVLEAFIEWSGEDNDYYIHVDGKVSLEAFEPLRRRKNVFFAENRIVMGWGDNTLGLGELILMRMTVGRNYDYIAVVSGDTLPLYSDAEIKKRLLARGLDTEYIIEGAAGPGVENLVRYLYPVEGGLKRRTLAGKILQTLRLRLKLMPLNPLYDHLPAISKGLNWWLMTPAFRDYALGFIDENPWYLQSFDHACCNEEMIMHTIMKHSPFLDKVISEGRWMYTDWSENRPNPRLHGTDDIWRIVAAKTSPDNIFLTVRKIADDMDLDEYRRRVLEA